MKERKIIEDLVISIRKFYVDNDKKPLPLDMQESYLNGVDYLGWAMNFDICKEYIESIVDGTTTEKVVRPKSTAQIVHDLVNNGHELGLRQIKV